MGLRRSSGRDKPTKRVFDPTPYVEADFPPLLRAIYGHWFIQFGLGVAAVGAGLGFLIGADGGDRLLAVPALILGALMLWASRAAYMRRSDGHR